MVPVGEGAGDTKSDASGMFTLSGAIAVLNASRVCCLSPPFSLSSTSDWNTSLMLVLGKRKVHLRSASERRRGKRREREEAGKQGSERRSLTAHTSSTRGAAAAAAQQSHVSSTTTTPALTPLCLRYHPLPLSACVPRSRASLTRGPSRAAQERRDLEKEAGDRHETHVLGSWSGGADLRWKTPSTKTPFLPLHVMKK